MNRIGIWCNWQHNRFWSCYSRFEPWYPNSQRTKIRDAWIFVLFFIPCSSFIHFFPFPFSVPSLIFFSSIPSFFCSTSSYPQRLHTFAAITSQPLLLPSARNPHNEVNGMLRTAAPPQGVTSIIRLFRKEHKAMTNRRNAGIRPKTVSSLELHTRKSSDKNGETSGS